MRHELDNVVLRKPEPHDVEPMYAWKNDPGIASMLGGFTTGYTRADLTKWVEFHRSASDEALFMITDGDDKAIGHVGLYKINGRAGTAEFAILLGDRGQWGKGLGRTCSRWMCQYGFDQLNLNRIALEVLATNQRAHDLYTSLGFVGEGRLRQAAYKDGSFVDVIVMGLLRGELRA